MKESFRVTCAFALVLMLASASPAAEPKKPSASEPVAAKRTAVDAVRDYTSMIKAGKGSAAAEKYWDGETMVQSIFGDNLKQHSADEVKQINDLWLGFISKVFANPETLDAMKQASFINFKSADENGGEEAVVTYQTKLGDKTIANKLRMKRESTGWKIVDLATNGQLFVESLQKAYAPQAKKISPLKFMQALAAQQPVGKKSAEK